LRAVGRCTSLLIPASRQLLAVLAHQAQALALRSKLQYAGALDPADQQRARFGLVAVEARHGHRGVAQRGERDGLAARP
jgi:hypothetical protein